MATRGDINDAEGANIVEGMRWTHRQVKRKSVLVASEDFLRSLHQHMFGEVWDWAGRFRATERNFGVAPHQIAMELRQLFDNM